MTKTIFRNITLFIFLLTVTAAVAPVRAELVAGNSAKINYTQLSNKEYENSQDLFIKKMAIKNYILKYNAPLADETDAFIKACTQYDLDCYLLPAISGVESSFGQYLRPGTFNPFGWGRGDIPFSSFSEAIMTVGKGLKENYINKGATSVEQIGRIYCEGDTWAGKVTYFMNQLEKEEKKVLSQHLVSTPCP
ncbi:glucosaminidase domain-containing protein [Candidatus Roizmanbacteria bacterium]|nr:glucosaminidase domain-containing protein [Candidatus Roizmanbacteria bacterium]